MPYIAPEIIMEAKRMDLLTYLENYEPHELVRFAGNTYTPRTHDSLKRKMDVVVARYRGQICPRLSCKSQRTFISRSRRNDYGR